MKKPLVVGLTICKRMAVDPSQGETSLIGLFHSLGFRQFPTPAQSFTVYGALYGGTGEGIMELVCSRMETEEDVYRYQKWLYLPGPGTVTNLEMKVTRCSFPASGTYAFTLRVDGESLTHRSFEVYRKRRRS